MTFFNWSARLILATTILPMVAACSLLSGSAIPDKIMDACVTTQIGKIIPTDHSYRKLLELLTRSGGKASWEGTSEGAGIIHIMRNDTFAGKTHQIDLEVQPLPQSEHEACKGETALVSRIKVDGELMSPYNTSDIVLGWNQALDKERKAAGQTMKEQAQQPVGTPAPPIRSNSSSMGPAQDLANDEAEVEDEGRYYAEQANIVARQPIVITDNDTSYLCCIRLSDVMRYFSTNGASYKIYADDHGGASLEVSDPAGRWNGWTSMTLEFVRAYPADAPLILSQIKVGDTVVADINDSSQKNTNSYLRGSFRLRISESYE